ncbi:MAG: restriction endonuclease subunit S [Pirellulaceae bacterium]|nr:restriction endonuclease subunit S [Pirellulaceae bacterium]
MIEGLKPYPDYKESGLPWLGTVPAHWRIRRIKTVLKEKDARSSDGSGTLLSLTRNRGLVARSEMTDKVHGARTLVGYKLYNPGEIVMNRMQAWSGMFGAGPIAGLVSPDYAVFQIIGQDLVDLLLARIKAPDLVSQFALESKGIGSGFNRLYSDRLGAIAISLPPPDEQAAIVRFLDHANRKIDGFIRAKRKLIGLLNEQKQVIIHQAVTRGLNPDVPVKPSGIPWLGDIPEHWEALQVRRLVSFVTSGSRGWARFYSDDGYIFIQSGNLGRSMGLNFAYIQHVRPPSGSEGERTQVRRDDVLVCVTGALTGNTVHVDQDLALPAFVNQHVALLRPRVRMVKPRFLAYALRSEAGRIQFKTSEYGGTKQGLGLGDVKSVFIAVPPLVYQDNVIAHLDRVLGHFDETITRTEREIALVQEYRTRLTADVVTGKLDVREAAAKLPDTPETALPLETDGLDDLDLLDDTDEQGVSNHA